MKKSEPNQIILSICDVDFLNAPIENVADAQVVATYVDGVKVFGE